ncbi:hypothetical protein [Gemmatimonas sp.]|uniref:hypothetical protein n=1 Tax=Gemmatimonas sp. TaxID=1962908 RepID=UPI0025C66E02|nr:hypothetical protein [Gemmatimonas sp.]MCA2992500.1 hypothetical protein [Gemmatimonas sp.]
MSKRMSNRHRAARATVDLFLSQGAGLFSLLLWSRSAPYSTALEARNALNGIIEERVRACIVQLLAALEVDDAIRAQLITTRTQEATARVIARLPRCASRSKIDFMRWLERQIADAVDGEDGDPHGGPAAQSPVADVSESWALHTLPIPRAERDALVAAVLEELTPDERYILHALEQPQAMWADVAATLGITIFETKRRHQQADARAHEIAVRLAMRAAGGAAEPDAKKAA